MLNTDDGIQYSGRFYIDGHTLDGELIFDGARSKLYVQGPDFFRPDEMEDRCVKGVLRDLTKVSLFDCLAQEMAGSSWSNDGSFWFSDIIPHYVLHGRRHLEPKDQVVRDITFLMSDAHLIFQDHDSFFPAFDPKPRLIHPIVREYGKIAKRKIPVGRRPVVAIFSGREGLIHAKTVLGDVKIFHKPWASMGSSEGIYIKNYVWTTISFHKPTSFHAAIESMFPVLKFMEIMAGREQEISKVHLSTTERDREKRHLEVYWTRPPKRTEHQSDRTPHGRGLPIDGVRERGLFTSVLEGWLALHQERKLARARFSTGFTKENWFDTDRLIGAANMFDLLPTSAGPRAVPLPSPLRQAHDRSKAIFKALPQSSERDSILSALGRLKQPSLKRKIYHRAEPVVAALGHRLPHLDFVINLAVDARNYFVHGSVSKYDFTGPLYSYLGFFTQVLEFIFAVADLHDAGYPIKNLTRGGAVHSHPFGHLLFSYPQYIHALKADLPSDHPMNVN